MTTPRPLFLVLLLFSLPVVADEIAVSYGRSDFAQRGDSPTIGVSYSHALWSGGLAARFGIHRSDDDFPDNQGNMTVNARFATLEYHFFRNRLLSPYLGAGLTHASASVEHSDTGFTSDDSAVTAMGDAGVDVNFTPRFAIGVNVTYMKFDPDLGDRHGSALHPLTKLVSVKYRF